MFVTSLHALFTIFTFRQAVDAQNEMHRIQGVRGISFAGAYLRYGFHEDGFTSGLKAAISLGGVDPPFAIGSAERKPVDTWLSYAFDIFEISGARVLFGAVLAFILSIARTFLAPFLDLSALDA